MAKSIEIKTAHNIVVYFELASLSDRILATMIDLVIIIVVSGIFAGFVNAMGLSTLASVGTFLFVAFYHLFFEIFNNGQSIGKHALSIKVVNLKGMVPNPPEAFQRWVFRMIDITFSLGALAGLFITSSPKNQRLGDLIAGCAVIKIKKASDVSFDRIERIQAKEREVLYPKVVVYKDLDMLLVKEVLARHQKFKNDSTRKAIRALSKKVAEELKITQPRVDHKAFLEDVLKDYVSLTR